MKINWGGGLVIGMVLFIGFILYFVIQIMTNKKYEFELVTEDYYSKEMVFQDELNASRNSYDLKENIVSKRTREGLVFTFPKGYDYSKIDGTINIYRPSNSRLDFDMPLRLTDSAFVVPADKLVEGRYSAIVTWNYDGKTYRYKNDLYY
ncbi:MAG TPA: FixH family protein [Flavobacteriaceae bacterium]|nr:FixH family protein [Flavobacteriaceae bacterium]